MPARAILEDPVRLKAHMSGMVLHQSLRVDAESVRSWSSGCAISISFWICTMALKGHSTTPCTQHRRRPIRSYAAEGVLVDGIMAEGAGVRPLSGSPSTGRLVCTLAPWHRD